MPFQAVAYAFREEMRPLAKLIFIWLANEADPEGLIAPLHLERLVWFTGTTERRVKTALRASCEELGNPLIELAEDFRAARIMLPVRGDYWETGQPTKRKYKPDPEALEWIEWYSGGRRCAACGCRGALQLDHIYPLSKGGEDSRHNLQLLCQPCNGRKKDKLGWVAMA